MLIKNDIPTSEVLRTKNSDTESNDNINSITIIHFNDCYNIEPGPESSGAAGFLTAINRHKHLNPMILFSGDILSPSFMSTFTKGEQMIPVLNDIGVHCAVFGNHEFDYGVDNLIDFVKKTSFPWLLSNVIDKETSNQLGDGLVYHIIERSGIKFGLIGLIEEEWLSTLSTLDSSDVIYEDFAQKGKELARWLKSEPNKVDYVIALTHSRTPNDIRLADLVPEIDLILGGHDHDYEIIKRPNCHIIKSGTDFREFSKITLKINSDYLKIKQDIEKNNNNLRNTATTTKESRQTPSSTSTLTTTSTSTLKPFLEPIEIERIECLNYEQDKELKSKLDKFVTTIDEKMNKVLGQFNCELDGRFASIRKTETNLGNFVTDIMLASTHADLAILNSGTLRSDRIHPKGDFTMRDLFNILGYIDPIAVLLATGNDIWQALENGVSQWPKLEGRFPQVSGCSFTFNPNKPAMNRIDPRDITIGDEQLVLDKQYRLTTKAYLASGKDGYDMLKKCQILVPGDESPDLTTSILNHFEAISIIKSNRRTHHRQSIICLSRNSLKKILDQNSSSSTTTTTTTTSFDSQQQHKLNNNYNLSKATPSLASGQSTMFYQGVSFDNNLDGVMTTTPDLSDNHLNNLKENRPNDDNNNDINKNVDRRELFGEDADAFGEDLVNISNGLHGHIKTPAASSPLTGSMTPTLLRNSISGGAGGETELFASNTTMAGSIGGVLSPSSTTSINTPSFGTQIKPRKRIMSLYEIEQEQCQLEPKVEGRIRIVGVNT